MDTPADLNFVRVCTDDLPVHDRIAIVREVFGRQMMRLEIEPMLDAPFRADLTVRMLPELSIASATNSPMRAGRTRELIADGDDSLVIQLFNENAFGSHLGREVAVGPGDAVVLSNADVGHFDFPSGSTTLALRVPRRALDPLLHDRDAVLGRAVPRDTAALRLLVDYLGVIKNPAAASPELQHLMAVHVYDLLALALGATRDAAADAQRRGVRAARLRGIKADIAAHLGDAGLSAAAVARRQGISESYIRKLFENEHTSFTDFVLMQRLARAHRLLTDPRFASRPVSAIAFEAGFGDLSYFNRCFRRRFGDTPSAIRADGRNRGSLR
jgi:AraC-like DNA-binding protein